MKIILNEDVKSLGEMGDTKNVANGYYRNFLFPRGLAVPYNDATVAFFEGKKAEIEARKEQKRKDSASLKEKLEAAVLEFTAPAGTNGKLYGAVTAQIICDLLAKAGFDIERKRIDIPGLVIKSTGNYKFTVRLYESQVAEMKITVKGQEDPEAAKKAVATEKKGKKAEEAPAAEEKTEETKAE